MNAREFHHRLSRRAKRAGVVLPEALTEKLWLYYQLLARWNEKINLTGLELAEPTPETLDRLLMEPLLAARYAGSAPTVIDIGSGGGSPAIPFALALPGSQLTMVESKTRKSVFLREVVRELGLDGGSVLTSRHESLLSNPALHEGHDILTIRAVRVESKVFATLQAFVKPGGAIFHFRGAGDSSLPSLAPPLFASATHSLVESLRSQLVILEKSPERHLR